MPRARNDAGSCRAGGGPSPSIRELELDAMGDGPSSTRGRLDRWPGSRIAAARFADDEGGRETA